MALDHSDIIDAIETIMKANSSPVFNVIVGEPLGLPPGDRHAAFWYLGRQPKFANLRGDIEVIERYQIVCYWLKRTEPSTLEAFENEIADADQALSTAFRANATLSGHTGPPYKSSPTLEITDSEVSFGGFPSNGTAIYRALEFELHILDREGEPTVL